MSENQRVALVSGANRGIGREIAKQLANKGMIVIVTARNEEKGKMTAAELAGQRTQVLARQLDVTAQASVDRLAEAVNSEFGRLDVLVNNAGIYIDGPQQGINADLEIVKQTLETNLFGAWRLCKAFIPLMQQHSYGRIVNVSSDMGQLEAMSGGYPAYRVSKTALNALTRILAAELGSTNILFNSVCPGWVKTDMGGAGAMRSVEKGAETPVWLATLPDGGPTGGFFQDCKPIPW